VYALTSATAFACYLIWPLWIDRPSYDGPGVGRWLMREVVSVDGAANCAPSSHVFYAVLAALLVGRAARTPAVRAAVWVLAVAVSATTVTTGQHYFVDVVGGVVVSLFGYSAVRALLPAGPVAATERTDAARSEAAGE
jgi:membrane-associated phospholipid phosphatase